MYDLHICIGSPVFQLPQCLCLHIQRTVWLNNGMPMKRFERVMFPEVLGMGEYVYHKNKARRPMFLPLNTMDNGLGNRLVGGRNKNGWTKL